MTSHAELMAVLTHRPDVTQADVDSLTGLAGTVLDLGLVTRACLHPDATTPESDTTHTVMLSVLVLNIAERWYPYLDPGRLAVLALVHDMVEAICGDVNTWDLDEAGWAAKAAREAEALAELRDRHATSRWLLDAIEEYETLSSAEARLVKSVDKILPSLTSLLGGGETHRRLVSSWAEAAQVWSVVDWKLATTYGAEYAEIVVLHQMICNRLGPLLDDSADTPRPA